MKKPNPATRSRQDILADIHAIPQTTTGKLSQYQKTLANGTVVTRHHIQEWKNGRNVSSHVPEHKLETVKAAIENGKQLKKLFTELTQADTATLLAHTPENTPATDAEVKKNGRNPRNPLRESPRNRPPSPPCAEAKRTGRPPPA